MAAPGAPVTVTVTYSNEKHSIQVASQQEDGEPTLQDMAVLIEQVTGVPVPFQKLIYKGKSLKELEQPLSALGVKNGCKVMLIGKRNSPEEEAELKKLKDLEKSVEQIANKLEEVNKEFTGIQKGFLAKNLQAEALKQLDKRIKGTAEQFMKILEQIDAILLPPLCLQKTTWRHLFLNGDINACVRIPILQKSLLRLHEMESAREFQ
ncbi:PREDICTED: BAG family molecular chaperone regulator 1 isoform X2 [Calidris pugnax]|uniref:BAG family molecular chaperone regulator 1 isoform X2 n=1 Tax=Calidris pugnax TaxID=198806 RepID=UPI00071DBE35|nr:PREDICTED: BAG family molecular chaperone regulator 1 isoform X2 [Calidris pugnax]